VSIVLFGLSLIEIGSLPLHLALAAAFVLSLRHSSCQLKSKLKREITMKEMTNDPQAVQPGQILRLSCPVMCSVVWNSAAGVHLFGK
jgi:hypothetical protein